MSDDEKTFITGIIANPGEDLCRGVYADWLDEHGEEGHALAIRDMVSQITMISFREAEIIRLAVEANLRGSRRVQVFRSVYDSQNHNHSHRDFGRDFPIVMGAVELGKNFSWRDSCAQGVFRRLLSFPYLFGRCEQCGMSFYAIDEIGLRIVTTFQPDLENKEIT